MNIQYCKPEDFESLKWRNQRNWPFSVIIELVNGYLKVVMFKSEQDAIEFKNT